jgi:hypothetical protein
MITKEKLEEKLSNGEVCGNCHASSYCGETGQDCQALILLRYITDYPSFEHSIFINQKSVGNAKP